jgi:pimeloyl-ACP methyl ester carboxylesterase
MLRRLLLPMMLLALPALVQEAHAQDSCLVGAWRLASGKTLDISPGAEGLRWRMFDGTTGKLFGMSSIWHSMRGWTGDLDGHRIDGVGCAEGRIAFDGAEARRVRLDISDTAFDSATSEGERIRLAGRLVLPEGEGPFPVVVLVQGSEAASAVGSNGLQRLLPAEGVGVFVYDKRGTGLSSGRYTQDFDLLAADATAALAEARRLAGDRVNRAGYFGMSMGGWVAPLAASRSNADFVIVASGLAISPLEQNRAQIVYEMEEIGHGEAEIAMAMEIAEAGERILLSGFTRGFTEFDEVRARYRSEPWYGDVRGNYLYLMMPLTGDRLKARENSFKLGTPWLYDPMTVLSASTAPQLWLLAEEDIKTPSAETARRIESLRARGLPFTAVMFPNAGHAILEYETRSDGVRIDTRNPDGYLSWIRDFALGGALPPARK